MPDPDEVLAADRAPLPSELLEEYLTRRDGGGAAPVADLLDEAGEGAEELRQRLAVLGELEQLAVLLSEDQSGVPADLERLGRFENLRLVGEGGLSRVFAAHDPRLGREVALKVLSPSSLDTDARNWMLSEGRSLARLQHESIVRVFEIDEVEGYAYIAMEQVVGPTLHETLEAMRALRDGESTKIFGERTLRAARALQSVPDRCLLVTRIARALAYCHAQGMVHRDVKPANVLIDADGTPKVIDFGLAHLESGSDVSLGLTQKLVGTPAYISPEQVDEKRTGASPASDQFSLGIVLYELLTLENPFNKQTRDATLAAISRAAPPPLRSIAPEMPIDVERIALHCLERVPGKRYAGIAELANDLEAFLSYRAISVQAPSPLKLLTLWTVRNKRQVWTAVVVAAVVLTFAAALWLRAADEKRQGLEERVARAVQRVPDLARPDDMRRTLLEIGRMREEAREHDVSALAGWLLPRTEEWVQELADAASERLNVLLNAKFDAAREAPPHERVNRYLTAGYEWNSCIDTDEDVNPISDVNQRYHDMGSVMLPEEGTLWSFLLGSPAQAFAPAPFDRELRLPPGFYRFTIATEGGILERDFSVIYWEERKNCTPLLLHENFEREMKDCPQSKWSYFDQTVGAGYDEYEQARFRILPRLVTWGEVRRFLGDEVVDKVQGPLRDRDLRELPERLADDMPANLTWQDAQAFASAVGGRLPTVPEVVAAVHAGVIDMTGAPLDLEHTSSYHQDQEHRSKVGHAGLRDALERGDALKTKDFTVRAPAPPVAAAGGRRKPSFIGLDGQTGFRIAISTEERISSF